MMNNYDTPSVEVVGLTADEAIAENGDIVVDAGSMFSPNSPAT